MSRLTLRTVGAAQAQFSRRLGAGARLAFSAHGLTGTLTLRPLLAVTLEYTDLAAFQSALGPFRLSDAEALLSLLGDLPVTLDGDHQPWYWQALNQRFSPQIAELLGPLAPLSGITAPSVGAQAAELSCRIELGLGEHRVHGVLCATAEVLLRWLDAAPWTARLVEVNEDWPVHTPLELGGLSLTLAQLASLQPGDVVLPTHPRFDSQGHGRLHLGGQHWAVQTDSHDRQLYVRFSHEEAQENDP
ncbi:type III secretion system protein [Pseudomonas sp. GD03842]|uniref:type III secretion system protein n=1 Tax=Pseudomonas sp. GD03842 TaxID=2975385 RepID=UPI00244921C5|nr:type III secretion system protein [Pseudomonas sp. GD03842]MDH0749748.1 type III secretion system protein [Pseudomonas sp. GD03842]